MEVILTPTAVPDKFGLGLNGFAGSVPGPPTQLSEQWFDSVQMELVNVIIGQGIALDGLVFDQMKQALDDYSFVDPAITGTLTVEAGGDLTIESGATLTADNGSTCTFNGDVIVGGLASFTVNCDADFMNDVQLGDTAGDTITIDGVTVANEIVNLQAGAFLDDQEIEGGVGSIVDVDRVQATTLELDDSGTSISQTSGHVRHNDTAYIAGDGAAARALSDPSRGWDPSHVETASLSDTGATADRRIQYNEPVIIKVTCSFEIDAVPEDMNMAIRVTGPLGNVNIDVTVFRAETANAIYGAPRSVVWTPTDTWPAENATQGYNFRVRIGATGGAQVTATNILLEVESGLQV